MTIRSTRRGAISIIGAGILTTVGCLGRERDPEEQLDDAADELSSYSDVSTALEDGYEMSFPYVSDDNGVLGMPFINHGVDELDADVPNILWYNLAGDGTFELIGAKWYVPHDEGDEPPSLFGENFEGPMAGETDDIPEHYGLNVWLFEDNSAGMFAASHADVEPPSYLDSLLSVWETVTPYFSNEELAFDDGYVDNEECFGNDDGDYGIPLVNPDRAGLDIDEPGVLMYRFGSNWSYRLQGVEWFVSTDDASDAPELFDQTFHEPMEGHTPDFPDGEHYGLHAWLFTANPDGIFSLFTPREIC